ncbi:MAG: hypothetical protein AVO39_10105 [delta proteobacterium MLS_D]|jgi:signal transduction histidine kinase|nr:MAG: hypothetical protein AVO39_10105 [delta proteobacterium MLS_D]
MDENTILLEKLKSDFQDTVIRDLLPGILHNFANPLNGIMGRSRLLQKRASEVLVPDEKGSDNRPSDGARKKVLRDVDLIVEQGDRFYELFAQVSGKMQRIHDMRRGPVNLSELAAAEVAFLDFYLDFKHSIEKHVNLTMDVPGVDGVVADYSLALSAILRYVMNSMLDCPVRIFSVFSDYDSAFVSIVISDTGVHDEGLAGDIEAASAGQDPVNDHHGIIDAVKLLKKYDARVTLDTNADINKITISVPHGER